MDMREFIFQIIAIAVSAFSLGMNLALYVTSEFRVRDQVHKKLEEAMNERCERCQFKNDFTSAMTDTTNAAMDK